MKRLRAVGSRFAVAGGLLVLASAALADPPSPVRSIPTPIEGGIGPAVLKLGISLVFVIALIFGLQRAARRWGRTFSPGGDSDAIEVLIQRPIGPRLSLAVVRVLGRGYLIGVSPQGIHPVAELGDDFEASLRGPRPSLAPSGTGPSFLERLLPGWKRSFGTALRRSRGAPAAPSPAPAASGVAAGASAVATPTFGSAATVSAPSPGASAPVRASVPSTGASGSPSEASARRAAAVDAAELARAAGTGSREKANPDSLAARRPPAASRPLESALSFESELLARLRAIRGKYASIAEAEARGGA